MNGMIVVECATCGAQIEGKVIAIQGSLFGGQGTVVGGLLDDNGAQRTCPRCKAKLSAPRAQFAPTCNVAKVA